MRSEPKSEPPASCCVLLQDHGVSDGGWGIAAALLPGLGASPLVYAGEDPQTIEAMKSIAREIGLHTGKPTLLARFTQREDVYSA